MSDERLARRAAKGDRRAFEAIFRRYQQPLYRYCLATVGNPHDAQDALQNTMVKVLRALPGEERQIKLKPWLYRIARNEAIETVRRRRPGAELDPEQPGTGPAPAETAEARERLRGLLADLEQLPERQRAALTMRELSGLGFEQIAEALGTSGAVARQTVYEARLSLRQMKAGREMRCEDVMRELSDADGRVTRRREVRSHLRACAECRAFRDEIAERRNELAAIAPLPAVLATGLLHGALGGGSAATAGGAAAGATAGAGGAVATSAVVKSVATVAVVVAVGAGAADRGGLVDVPLPGSGGEPASSNGSPQPTGTPVGGGAVGTTPAERRAGAAKVRRSGDRQSADQRAKRQRRAEAQRRQQGTQEGRGHGTDGAPRGRPEALPPASQRGQDAAAARKAPQARTMPGPRRSPGATAGARRPPAKSPPPRRSSQGALKKRGEVTKSPLTKTPETRLSPESKHPTSVRP